ncbi:MAG: DNA-directed RNA polymerase subunit beta [Ureaplasma sp.]|nr:DNA-directed RNA polymerase subunit beta [Ureaplasma sp.]
MSHSYSNHNYSKKVMRRDYAKVRTNFEWPDLLETQKASFENFINNELEKLIASIFPIESPQNKYTLKLNKIELGKPRKTEEMCRDESKVYSAPLYGDFELINNETGEVKRAKITSANKGIFFGNIPLITNKATFIINGIEKFVISQIIRSPGMYVLNKSQIKLNNSRKRIVNGNICELLPYKGSLMLIHSPINHNKDIEPIIQISARNSSGETVATFLATTLLKGYGLTTNEIKEIYNNNPVILSTLEQEKYNHNDVMSFVDMQSLYKEISSEWHSDESEENIVNRGIYIERKLRSLIYQLIILKDKNGLMKDENANQNIDEIIKNNSKIADIFEKIIIEKAAKDVCSELGLNAKSIENQVKDENMCYQALLSIHLFNHRYYDLSSAGRYKLNHKLRISDRLYQRIIAQDVVDNNGKVLIENNTLLTKEHIDLIKNNSDNISIAHKLKIKHAFVDFNDINTTTKEQLSTISYEKINILVNNNETNNDNQTSIIGLTPGNYPDTLTISDVIATIGYSYNLLDNIGTFDDIDHLGNKRLKLIHEQLKNRLQTAMLRIEKSVQEKLAIYDGSQNSNDEVDNEEEKKKLSLTIKSIINTKPFQIILKDFFNSYQLIQFIDQQNPLSELTNKRRISAMGPGGISREDPNLDIRDVHYSHYGRICPIETPEGMNIGLITSLASFSKVDENGFITTPYRVVKNGVLTDEIKWLTPLQDDNYIIGEANLEIDENNLIQNKQVVARYRGSSNLYDPKQLDFIDVSPKQVVSVAASVIPFLENDDANRALMGANMQRQAVPLINPHAPWVGTGNEYKIAHDSGMSLLSDVDGSIKEIDGNHIVIVDNDGKEHVKKFVKFHKSNQNTCINQTPIVEKGESVKVGDVLCNGPAMQNGELSLGQNVLVGFTTWNGYNFEDAIVLSKRLVEDDVYTSIHVDEYTLQCLSTKNGDEEITRDIPNVSDNARRFLDPNGIIMIGADVKEGDVLVGKITPRGQIDLSPEEKLLQSIFGDKTKKFKDSSLKVPHGGEGIVAAVKRFTNTDEISDLGDDVIEVIKVYVVQKRKIQVGDKMAGRHGNKGIVSNIVPVEDMPYLDDGTPLDILLNPLGVPSRMNIGQILEIHLGLAARELGKKELLAKIYNNATIEDIIQTYGLRETIAKTLYTKISNLIKSKNIENEDELKQKISLSDLLIVLKDIGLSFDDLGFKIATPVFEGVTHKDLTDIMNEVGIDPIQTKGKFKLRDGKTGDYFDGEIAVGVMYMLKLDHMVDDKIHARSVGPYSKITQQPLGGKSQNGGQRFGEMEVWALEAYGAAHNLHEILTIKSDDVYGRNQTYSAIIKGREIPRGGIPESFKLLTKQLQGLGIYLEVIDKEGESIDINKYISYESNVDINKDKSKSIIEQEIKAEINNNNNYDEEYDELF